MTSSSVECQKLVELAADMGLTLMVGHTFEYNPAVEMLRDIVRSGEIGEVFYVSTTRTNLGLFQPDINVVWDHRMICRFFCSYWALSRPP